MAFCCCSLATGAKVIAIISLVNSILSLLLFFGYATYAACRMEKLSWTDEILAGTRGLYGEEMLEKVLNVGRFDVDIDANSTIIDGETYYKGKFVELLQMTISYFGFNYCMLYTFLAAFSLVANIELFQGVKERNYLRCQIWVRWCVASLITTVVFSVMILCFTESWVSKLVLFTIVYTMMGYLIFVVVEFMKEIKSENGKRGRN